MILKKETLLKQIEKGNARYTGGTENMNMTNKKSL